MNVALREHWTVERFLRWEDRQEGRHEFDGAQITEVTGGTRAHQRIVFNLVRQLVDRLDPSRFDAVQEMRIVFEGRVRYPDVAVVRGPIPEQTRTLSDPVVLFEVVSPDSAAVDYGAKREEYFLLASLQRYVVFEQTAAKATVYTRDGASEATISLHLPEIGLELIFSEVDRGLTLS
jgi:Uma2 family endonuclease